jgi:hypothetical protein
MRITVNRSRPQRCIALPMEYMWKWDWHMKIQFRISDRATASVVWWLACWPLVPEFAGFKPVGFFQYMKKSSACLPSEGKWKNVSHAPALRHVKDRSTAVNYIRTSQIPVAFKSKGPPWHSILLYHHSHHRDNVTAPHRRPNLRNQLTLLPCPGGKTTKSTKDLWWH